MATEAGLEVVAPFHDALLLLVQLTEVDESLEFVAGCWSRASAALLEGFELRCEVNRKKAAFEYPRRYFDGRQSDFFDKALTFLAGHAPHIAFAALDLPLQGVERLHRSGQSLPWITPRRPHRDCGMAVRRQFRRTRQKIFSSIFVGYPDFASQISITLQRYL